MREWFVKITCNSCGASEMVREGVDMPKSWRQFNHPKYPSGIELCGNCFANPDMATKLLIEALEKIEGGQ
jgi:hypothetical protein